MYITQNANFSCKCFSISNNRHLKEWPLKYSCAISVSKWRLNVPRGQWQNSISIQQPFLVLQNCPKSFFVSLDSLREVRYQHHSWNKSFIGRKLNSGGGVRTIISAHESSSDVTMLSRPFGVPWIHPAFSPFVRCVWKSRAHLLPLLWLTKNLEAQLDSLINVHGRHLHWMAFKSNILKRQGSLLGSLELCLCKALKCFWIFYPLLVLG